MKKIIFLFMTGCCLLGNGLCQDLNQGLVAYYPFNGNANDESGNGNHGIIYGAELTTDRFGNTNAAYHFNGANKNYIDCGNNTSLNTPYNLTICAWIKKEAGSIIVSKWKTQGTYSYGSWAFRTGSFWFTYDGWSGQSLQYTDSFVGGQFYFFVVKYDYSANLISVYVDGDLIATKQGMGKKIYSSNAHLLIGAQRWYTNGPYYEAYFTGTIDELRIYNRVLTDDEIRMLADIETDTSVFDIDGNPYPKLQIGNQTWMGSNLKTSRYNDGEVIPGVIDNNQWNSQTTGAYCWFNNDSANYEDAYGKLYNWHTVNSNKLCPNGWRVPYAAEWKALYEYLGGDSVAGGTLKQTGVSHWKSPNTGASDSVGFTGLPGGYRNAAGFFSPGGFEGKWWSLTDRGDGNAWSAGLEYDSEAADLEYGNYKNGYSVRCIKGDVATVETILAMDVTNGGAELCTHNKYFNIDKLEHSGLMLLSADRQDTIVIVNEYFEEEFCVTIDTLKPEWNYEVRHFVVPTGSSTYEFTGTPTYFTTGSGPVGSPAVAFDPPKDIELSCRFAEVGGKMIDEGDDSVTVRGIYFGTQDNPKITGDTLEIDSLYYDPYGTEYFLTQIDDLQPKTRYYAQAFAINSFGEGTGAVLDFKTRDDCEEDPHQNLDLKAGWNYVSLAVDPWEDSIKNIIQPLIDAGNLVKVQDEGGGVYEVIPGDTTWTDTIGIWLKTEGYKINVTSDQRLTVFGDTITGPTSIALNEGPNIISYPAFYYNGAVNILEDLIIDGTLVKAQNEKGQSVEFIPGTGILYDNIGYFRPGEGYKVNVTSEDTIHIDGSFYTAMPMKAELKSAQILLPTHFKTTWQGNGYNHMNLYVKNVTENGNIFIPGDEIAVYDGQNCVGTTVVENLTDEYISIIASADDPMTKEVDGFEKGKEITLKVWRNGVETEIGPLEFTPEKASVFEPEGTVAIHLGKTSVIEVPGQPVTPSISAYPNPFSNELVIDCNLTEKMDLTIEVRNAIGQLVYANRKTYTAGSHKIILDGKTGTGELSKSGIYYIKVFSANEKVNKTIKVIRIEK